LLHHHKLFLVAIFITLHQTKNDSITIHNHHNSLAIKASKESI